MKCAALTEPIRDSVPNYLPFNAYPTLEAGLPQNTFDWLSVDELRTHESRLFIEPWARLYRDGACMDRYKGVLF